MSILTIIQQACDDMGLVRPATVIGSSNSSIRQMLSLARSHGFALSVTRMWPQLIRRGSITLVNGQSAYALPDDYDRMIDNTQWDSTNHWRLVGPANPERWEQLESGLTTVSPRREYAIRGIANGQIHVFPTPDSTETGSVYNFQYMSSNWILPKSWVSSYTFAAGSYCMYDGVMYRTVSGGVSGSTPPTHTYGDATDGGITWSYESIDYSSFISDNDTTIFDDMIMSKGVQWRFLQANRLEYLDIKAESDALVASRVAAMSGAPTLDLSGRGHGFRLIDNTSIPDTGYGL